jgi:hypothetical protein
MMIEKWYCGDELTRRVVRAQPTPYCDTIVSQSVYGPFSRREGTTRDFASSLTLTGELLLHLHEVQFQ